jgi:hypothetical protein
MFGLGVAADPGSDINRHIDRSVRIEALVSLTRTTEV